jgi:O-antigen/teichoic acid export membrane protein
MKMSRLSRLIFGSTLSNLSRESATSLSQLLLVPMFISVFSSHDYGIWLLLSSYSSFVVLADFGLSTAVIVKIDCNPPWNSKSNNYLWVKYKRITSRIGIFICSLVLITDLLFFRTSDFAFHGVGFYLVITLCFLIISLQTLQQHNILYQHQLKNSYNQGMKILFRFRILEFLVTYIGLLLRFNMLNLALLITCFRQVLILIQNRFDFLVENSFEISSSDLSQNVLKDLWKPALGNGLLSFSVILGIQGTFVVAGTWASPTSLVTLGLARMLVSPIRIVSGSLFQGSLPHLIKIHSKQNSEKFPKNFQLRYNLGYLVTILVTVLIIFTTSKFVWAFLSRGIAVFPSTLVILFIISVVLDAICMLRFQKSMSQNRSLRLGVLYLIATCVSLIAQPIIANFSHLNAVPLSIIIGDLFFLMISLIQWNN